METDKKSTSTATDEDSADQTEKLKHPDPNYIANGFLPGKTTLTSAENGDETQNSSQDHRDLLLNGSISKNAGDIKIQSMAVKESHLGEVSSQVEETSSDEEDISDEDDETIKRQHNEEDGNEEPALRRSTRVRRSTAKYVNYQDDTSTGMSDSELSEKPDEVESDEPTIEKLLGRKPANKALLKKHIESASQYDGPFQYLCKFKGFSYLHLKWVHEDELRQQHWRINVRLQRFAAKANKEEEDKAEELGGWTAYYQDLQDEENEYFDPEYTEVDRILAEKKEIVEESGINKISTTLDSFVALNGKLEIDSLIKLDFHEKERQVQPKKVVKTMYLIKWSGLSYAESTWEFSENIKDDLQLALFRRRNRPPIGLTDGGKDTFESSEVAELNTALWPALGVNASQVSPIMRIKTKAKTPIYLPNSLRSFIMQGEVSGVLPGDEIIAVGDVSVQGKKLADTTAHIRARSIEARNGGHNGFLLTFRRFVKRREHLPIETVLFNIRFCEQSSLGLMLKSPDADHKTRPVARHPDAIPCVFVEDVLTPRFYDPATRGDTKLFTSKWLRYAMMSYVIIACCNKVYKHGEELEEVAESIGCELHNLQRWLKGWKTDGIAEEECVDQNELHRLERMLWQWLQNILEIFKFYSYVFVDTSSLRNLMSASKLEKISHRIRTVFKALEIWKQADLMSKVEAANKGEAKKRQIKQGLSEAASQSNQDKSKIQYLGKVEEIVRSMADKVAQKFGGFKFESMKGSNTTSLLALGTTSGPQDSHVKIARYLKRIIVAVAWLRAGSPSMFTSWMPLPEEAFVGVVDINQQRELQRQDMQYRAEHRSANREFARLPQKTDGWRYQQRYLGRLRKRTFIPYTPASQPRFKHGNQLRSYQLQGVNWLLSNWYRNISCILADEMGLGKTVQVVAMLEHMRTKENMRGPYLIVAPLSTIGHWHREIEGWTDMNICRYYDSGGANGRETIRKYEWYYPGYERRVDMIKFNVMVTTYETFMADVEYLMDLPWLCIVVDEGHRLRSVKSKLLDMLKRITNVYRLLLTGTPLQNNMQELWSLLNFCDRETFRSKETFLEEYGDLQSKEQLDALQTEIAPYILRRVKEDVEKTIPPKEETIIDIELTMLQKRYYRAIFDKNRQVLYKGCKTNNKPQLINIEMELRKCCNHPYLVAGVKERELKKLRTELLQRIHEVKLGKGQSRERKHNTRANGEVDVLKDDIDEEDEFFELGYDLDKAMAMKKSDNLIAEEATLERTIRSSGKLVLVDKLLPKLKEEGHKVLIFSQMKRMLDILESYCMGRGYGYERLDGSIQGNMRQQAIDRFCNPESKSFVFLLSTRAGGVGINLTAADTVIIFDSDWNPQNDAQAQARCHRIGQKKAVRIYRLVTKKTYEETMLQKAARKLGLERAVLGRVGKNTGIKGAYLTANELEKMLREGAYHHLDATNDEAKAAAKSFCDANIEDLLKTNSRTIQVDAISGQISMPSLTHNTVNKSSFNVDEGKGNDKVDVDDPDFWKKVLPDETSSDVLLSKLNDSGQVSILSNSAKARRSYMTAVRMLVRELLDLRESGEVISEHAMETACSILIQIANMKNVFKKDTFQVPYGQQKKRKSYVLLASKWLKLLEASRERRARRKTEKRKRSGSKRRGTRGRRDDSSDDELYSEDEEKAENGDYEFQQEEKGRLTEFSDEEPEERKKKKSRRKRSIKPGGRAGTMRRRRSQVRQKRRRANGASRKRKPAFDLRHYQEGYMLKDFTTEVCAICADGGSLVCCEGPCKRAFHMQCLNLSEDLLEDDADWYCPDCEDGKQRCMFCSSAGEQDHEVFKCQDKSCGRFFHLQCLKRSDLVKYPFGDKVKEKFICPLHTCRSCEREENVSIQCIRCPNAYHYRCLDKTNTLRLHLNLIICHEHLNGRQFNEESHASFDPRVTLYAALPEDYTIHDKKRVKVYVKYNYKDNETE